MYYLLKVCTIAVLLLGMTGFKVPESGWREYFQNDQIKIETSTQTCSNARSGTNNNYILLRVSNKTNQEVEVSFFKELWYNDICSNCNGGNEAKTSIILKANETAEGNCTSGLKDLKIFHSMPNGSKRTLSKFDIKNVTVSPLK